jgi:hypothetical protein
MTVGLEMTRSVIKSAKRVVKATAPDATIAFCQPSIPNNHTDNADKGKVVIIRSVLLTKYCPKKDSRKETTKATDILQTKTVKNISIVCILYLS